MKRFTSFIKEASNIDITYRSNIAVPTLSEKDLRENYISGKIFQIGSIVENLNTDFPPHFCLKEFSRNILLVSG